MCFIICSETGYKKYLQVVEGLPEHIIWCELGFQSELGWFERWPGLLGDLYGLSIRDYCSNVAQEEAFINLCAFLYL